MSSGIVTKLHWRPDKDMFDTAVQSQKYTILLDTTEAVLVAGQRQNAISLFPKSPMGKPRALNVNHLPGFSRPSFEGKRKPYQYRRTYFQQQLERIWIVWQVVAFDGGAEGAFSDPASYILTLILLQRLSCSAGRTNQDNGSGTQGGTLLVGLR